MKRIIRIISFFILIIAMFGILTTPTRAATQDIPLHFSFTTNHKSPNSIFDTFYYTPTNVPNGSYNFLGLSGSITLSGDPQNSWGIVLIMLVYGNNGCPITGQNMVGDYFWPIAPSPARGARLATFILKLNKPGSVTVPTEFTLPRGIPVPGCLSVVVNGGAPEHNAPMTITSTMTFHYDINPAVQPPVHATTLDGEYCIGNRQVCINYTNTITPQQAFVRMEPIQSHELLLSLFGNADTAGAYGGTCPTGLWNTTADFYVYHGKSCPTQVFSGPSEALSQIPSDAIKLYSATVNGNVCIGNSQSIDQNFNPPLELQPGDCIVQLQRFNTTGLLGAETQTTFITQDYYTSSPKPGDLDGDGKVDIFDYNILVTNFGHPYTIFDYNTLVENFGK